MIPLAFLMTMIVLFRLGISGWFNGQSVSVDQEKQQMIAGELNPELHNFNQDLYNYREIVKQRRCFLLLYMIVGVYITLFCGLRGLSVGSDTFKYAAAFYSYGDEWGYEELRDSYVDVDTTTESKEQKDVFYKIFCVRFADICSHHQALFLFMAFLSYIGPLCLFYRFSPNPLLSILLYIAISSFFFNFSGIRQGVAMSFCCLAFNYAIDKKLVSFLIFVFLGSMFHKSAFCFLPVYFLNFEFSKKTLAIYLAVLLVICVSPDLLIKLLSVVGNGVDARVRSLQGQDSLISPMSFIIHLTTGIFCLLFFKYFKESYPRYSFLYNIWFIGLVGYLMVVLRASIFLRISLYFSIFEVILIPFCLTLIKNKQARIITEFLIVVLCFAYVFQGMSSSAVFPYYFFWNDPLNASLGW